MENLFEGDLERPKVETVHSLAGEEAYSLMYQNSCVEVAQEHTVTRSDVILAFKESTIVMVCGKNVYIKIRFPYLLLYFPPLRVQLGVIPLLI